MNKFIVWGWGESKKWHYFWHGHRVCRGGEMLWLKSHCHTQIHLWYRNKLAASCFCIIEESVLNDFDTWQDNTVEETLDCLRGIGCLQPCLFRLGDCYFLKCDNTAIPLPSASCFTEAVEYLFAAFFVFNVEYPPQLRLFYQFLEHIIGVGSTKNSGVIKELLCALNIGCYFWRFCVCAYLYEMIMLC